MKNKPDRGLSLRLSQLLATCLTLWIFCVNPAGAADEYPLKPIDTSSPRSTLLGFLDQMNQSYSTGIGMLNAYLADTRLYLTPEEIASLKDALRYQQSAQRTLDLSELPSDLSEESSRRLAVQLKEVLDRLDLPAIETIPDAKAMAQFEIKRWTLPNTEIQIQRIENGPREGEYLFAPETLSRLPEFYANIKDLPYKPAASVGWYDFSTYSPAGVALALHNIVPTRWLIDSPRYQNRFLILDQPTWRWFGIAVVMGFGLLFVKLCFRLRRYWKERSKLSKKWVNLLRPASLMLMTALSALILSKILRISGIVYAVAIPGLWVLFYFAWTWLVWAAGSAIANSMMTKERIRIGSVDGQLILMVVRLLTFIAAVTILVSGADHLGLPAYSLLAGFGVGGLAVALAAQQTLANLLGSLIIMIEKPLAIGDYIKLKDAEGIVEKVGFRSTRIRTLYNSVVTIPSSQLINSSIDNMELRQYRQLKTILRITYDTPVEKIEDFVFAIKQQLESYPFIRKDNIQVCFYEFSPSSLDILLNFFIQAADRHAELIFRQQILLNILRLAENSAVKFAFPTQTLHIKSLSEETADQALT
jgi:MscS family membrane protein